MPALLEKVFPDLSRFSYAITSPATGHYNCIAWAAGDDARWWWPDPFYNGYWPTGVPRETTIDAFIEAYRTCGYEPCDNGHLEPGVEKVVIYAIAASPTHAARQLEDGTWTSKLGDDVDIVHEVPAAICNAAYGQPVAYVSRARTGHAGN